MDFSQYKPSVTIKVTAKDIIDILKKKFDDFIPGYKVSKAYFVTSGGFTGRGRVGEMVESRKVHSLKLYFDLKDSGNPYEKPVPGTKEIVLEVLEQDLKEVVKENFNNAMPGFRPSRVHFSTTQEYDMRGEECGIKVNDVTIHFESVPPISE